MQDFRDNEKKTKSAILDFILAKFVMGYPYILFYMHGPAILLRF